MGKVNVHESSDGRLRTELYEKNGAKVFCVAESTPLGILITEFSEKGIVLDQLSKKGDALHELNRHIGGETNLVSVSGYEHVRIKAKCSKCATETLERELDLLEPGQISNVPIVPLFRCSTCKQRFYSMSDEYLRNLVENNASLFTADDIADKTANEKEFVRTLHEYIIRIFASKKIFRLKTE